LDLSFTLGTTGIGFDLAAPIGDYVQVRAGYSIMPRFNYDMDFGIQVGDDPATSQSKFEKLSGLLTQITGRPVDNKVTMQGRPTYYNFNFLVDVFPFKNNKHWHFTAGFYLGPSKIADALNSIGDMQSLMAVNIYNNIYDKVYRGEPIITMNENDIYLDPAYEDKILSYGRMGIHIGDFNKDIYKEVDGQMVKVHSKGDPYMMEPDNEGTVNAEATANAFKPYVGFGYGGRLFKNNDKYKISFDCGAMFWGGSPDIVTHDGVNMAKDLTNIRGDVDDYVKLIKGVKVFPVVNLRISRTLF
ncbi:MAG: hypothetical protein Q4F34_07165, partial [Prevotellaceae bacterium]|nr:hypothetical protein [Prevotellaceae bacterium]